MSGYGDLTLTTGYVFCLALLGGGLANWTLAYVIIAIATILVSGVTLWRGGWSAMQSLPIAARVGLIGVAVIPLLQMIPLPPGLWHALPGQDLRLGTLSLAGIADSWQPLSIEPVSTALVAILAIGFVTLTMLLLRLNDRQFRTALWVVVGMLLAGICVGFSQVASNGWPQLQVSNMGSTMLGFYANKNHMAMAIACTIVLLGLGLAPSTDQGRHRVIVGSFVALALICIVTTNSRAGLGLGGLAAIIVFFHIARKISLRWRIAAVVTLVALVLAVASSDVFRTVSTRVGEVDDDARWSFLLWSRPLIEEYWVLGSGLGSFATLFAAHEQLAWVKPSYVNAIHDDYLQLILEAGVPGLLILLAMIVAVLGRVKLWLSLNKKNFRRNEMTAGFTILLLFMIHSFLDYPLRRPAAWIFCTIALAALFRPVERARDRPLV
ncbi:O-antigen ligase family protein [Sphingomonas yabuuchiae]|uniref:O-antigen ligase family protein n=1 Tax=Sphingomonas yabuuchiae TaxID=172044 RepID=UPI001428D4CE|nr:O-antigen ligase family protein [Sphingomonas yabuuchiae]